jgi:hypothetical protein
MNNEGKVLRILYRTQRTFDAENEKWSNTPLPPTQRRGKAHTQARKLRAELDKQVKIRVVKIIVYHDQDF